MNIDIIAMIILNAYLVAALLTFIGLYIRAKKERGKMEIKYDAKYRDWSEAINEKMDLYVEICYLKRRIKELEGGDETVQSND